MTSSHPMTPAKNLFLMESDSEVPGGPKFGWGMDTSPPSTGVETANGAHSPQDLPLLMPLPWGKMRQPSTRMVGSRQVRSKGA